MNNINMKYDSVIVKIDLDEAVKIKLTGLGEELYQQYHYEPPIVDANGYILISLRDLIKTFGTAIESDVIENSEIIYTKTF